MTDMMIAPTSTTPTSTPASPPLVDEPDGPLTCTAVVEVTHDVRTFVLRPAAPLAFLPGQHVTLRVSVGGEAVERCYTISSPPTRPDELAITVKRVPGGVVSPWLHDHLRVGDVVEASGPRGVFSADLHPAERLLLLTAGSGITPAMSMVRALRDRGSTADVVLVHCARTPDDIIFRDELEALALEGVIRLGVLCESESPRQRWSGRLGRLGLAALDEVAPDVREREVFTCGPAPFMAAVRSMLDQRGVDPARCHEELFTLGTAPPAARPAAVAGTSYAVGLRRSGRTVDCPAGTTLLEAVARAGVTLPSSCGEGVCGTCKLDLLSGQVDMQHQGGIRPREVARGAILPCCSTPLEDVEIDA